MVADQEEFHREKDRECMENEEEGEFRWEGWDWESDVGASNLCLTCGVPEWQSNRDVDWARGAFEPRE